MAASGCTNDPMVTVLEKSMVVPASPTNKAHFFLPSLDIIWQFIHYNRRLIFYKTSLKEVSDAVETLKRSLSLVLVHYYPWSGRIAVGDDKRLVIDCNDAGVEFVEASIDLAMSELEKEGFQMKAFFEKLCQHVEHKGDCLYTSPLLSVQATRFSDGGLAVGIAQSHVVADGQSLWNFMVSWGECARGVGLTVEPVHNRERLALPDPSPEKANLSLGFDVKEEDREDAEGEEGNGAVVVENRSGHPGRTPGNEFNGDHKGAENDPLTQCVFDLPATAIKQLKSEAGGTYTSYEVMCAHFWQRVTAARQAPSSEPAIFAVLANFRSRMTPPLGPLPPAYFGNVIMFASATGSVGKIRREKLADTAGRIHEAVSGCREDNLVAFMHWLELHDNSIISASEKSGWKPTGQMMNVASSPRFPVYEVDFGWGRPAAVRAVKVQGDGEMVLFGGRPGSALGDVEICMALPASVMRRLLKDPMFLANPPPPPPTCAFYMKP